MPSTSRPATPTEDRERQALSVSELNRRIHGLLEDSFPDVWVEGEVSDPRSYPSGHTYFTLKDAESQISAVLFKGVASGMKFKAEHGIQVLVRGRVTTYMKRGQYQLIVSALQPRAAGALQLAFEQLKARLAAEGLFAEERKKSLPAFPRRIGIVTSLAGAAVRDMLSILRRRFEGLHIRVYPVQVQGEGAAPQIAAAIADFNALLPDTEVLLVGRGGGSIEDLWAFNEEVVARAIAASAIPVVSCVGHETDFTIADFVADLRAPTPSAAAELVVQEREAVQERIRDLFGRLPAALLALAQRIEERFRGLLRSPALRRPQSLYEERALRVDELCARLLPALGHRFRLSEQRLPEFSRRLGAALTALALHADKDLRRLAEKLDALSPLKVLGRGYAIAFREPGRTVVRAARDVSPGDRVSVRVQEGEFNAEVIGP